MPLDATIGPARVIPIRDTHSIKRDELKEHALNEGDRILFKTTNSAQSWNSNQFDENFVFISQDAARYLAECKVRMVGVDYLSVGGFRMDGPETHHALLSAGIWVIEGLNLSAVEPGTYDMVCLPLRLMGAEGSPARAILRRNE
jgi:arylformamidase